jgi:Zn finger protein HypA/HybF involved in hydrogenase expression
MSKNNTTNCPQCGTVIEADPFDREENIISCPNCNTELKITKIYPLKVKLLKRANEAENDYMNYIEDEDETYPNRDY